MITLSEQAEKLSHECRITEGGFMFYNVKKEIFFMATIYSKLEDCKYAFKIYHDINSDRTLVDKLFDELKNYCLISGLEFTEK